MLKLLKYISLLSLVCLLTGCLLGEHGYIHNRKNVYLKSENLPKTRLPSGLQTASMQPTYDIPPGDGFSKRTAASIIPPGNGIALVSPKAKESIFKDSNQLTLGQGSNGFLVLKIPTAYNHAWQEVVDLLPKQGYQVMGSDSKTGIIEVQISAINKSNRIYQFSLLQGKNATLVSILDQSGNPVSDAVSKQLLTELRNGLGQQNEQN